MHGADDRLDMVGQANVARVVAGREAGSVMAVTSWPSARKRSVTSSHAQAPSQNPGTRMIGAVIADVTGRSTVSGTTLPPAKDEEQKTGEHQHGYSPMKAESPNQAPG